MFKVIGFGNILMGDDGIGPRVIEELRKDELLGNNENVIFLDCGTSGIDLIFMINENDNLIIIDAIDAGQEVAEIVKFDIEDVDSFIKKEIISYSIHDIGLAEVLSIMKSMNMKTKAKMIGIKPKSVEFCDKLTEEIESKIPDIVKIVKEEIEIL